MGDIAFFRREAQNKAIVGAICGKPLYRVRLHDVIVFDLVIAVGNVNAQSGLVLAVTRRHGNIIAFCVLAVGNAVVGTDAFKVLPLYLITAVAGRKIYRKTCCFAGLNHVNQRLGNQFVNHLSVPVITGADISIVAGHVQVDQICRLISDGVKRVIPVYQHVLKFIQVDFGRRRQPQNCSLFLLRAKLRLRCGFRRRLRFGFRRRFLHSSGLHR